MMLLYENQVVMYMTLMVWLLQLI